MQNEVDILDMVTTMTLPRLETGSLERSLRATLVALLTAVIVVTGFVAPVSAAAPVPRVALVVGPVLRRFVRVFGFPQTSMTRGRRAGLGG